MCDSYYSKGCRCNECKKQHAEYMREYYKRFPEKYDKMNDQRRRRREEDLEFAKADRERSKIWAKNNKEASAARSREWVKNNREKYLKRLREYSKKTSKIRVAKAAQWRKDNPEKVREYQRICYHRAKARKLNE